MIKRNRIMCKKCGDIIESKYRHDYVTCSCGACSVDGGHDYIHLRGNLDDIEFIPDDFIPEEDEENEMEFGEGFKISVLKSTFKA